MTMDKDASETGAINAAGFQTHADDVFGRIASRYDRLCDLFSLGIHRLWKNRVAAVIAEKPWQCLIDTASGTGDIVLRILRLQPLQTTQKIIASDISPDMLAIAESRIKGLQGDINFAVLDAEHMPAIKSKSMDIYSMSLGLKICNRKKALKEAQRVLKPGGCLVILEASSIPVGWIHKLYLGYMSLCMPIIGWLATGGDASAYKYLLEGVKTFPDANSLRDELMEMGFVQVNYERLSFGIVAIHVGYMPGSFAEDSL